MRKIVLFIALFGFYSLSVRSTHVAGGEITYRCVDSITGKYEVTVALYQNCSPGSAMFPNPITLRVFYANGQIFSTWNIPHSNITQIPVDTCVGSSNYCIAKGIYMADIYLPHNSGFYLGYSAGVRMYGIANIVNSGGSGMAIMNFIPDTSLAAFNSSAIHNQYPPIAGCINEPFTYNLSAQDADNDSLVYKLCEVLTDYPTQIPPYNAMFYTAGYSGGYPISSSPAFSIDPVTGIFSGTPNLLGIFQVGICVEEWRNGVLINTNRRDFPFSVFDCPGSATASVAEDTITSCGYQVQFNHTGSGAANYSWNFGNPFVTNDISSLENPTYTYPGTGQYLARLIVNNGMPCTDTGWIVVNVFPPFVAANILQDTIHKCQNQPAQFTSGFQNALEYFWDFGVPNLTNDTSALINPIYIYPGAGQFTAMLITNRHSPCADTDWVSVIIYPAEFVPALVPEDTIRSCIFQAVQFTSLNSNANTYFWDFGDPALTSDTSSAVGPSYLYQNAGNYSATLYVNKEFPCGDTKLITIIIYDEINVSIDPVNTNYAYNDPPVTLSGTPAGGIFAGPAISGNTFYPSGTGPGTHLITYTYTDSSGCSGADSVYFTVFPVGIEHIEFLQELKIYPNPVSDILIIEFLSGKSEEVNIRILDVNGRLILDESRYPTGGTVKMAVDLNNFSAGLYQLMLVSQGTAMSQKIIINK